MRVTWRPYQLDPTASKEGITKREYYNNKFGPVRAASILSAANPMHERFREIGIEVKWDGLTGQTMDAHRLLAHAEKVGGVEMQNRLMEELFLDYFKNDLYVGSADVLRQAAERAAVPEPQLVLDDGAYLKDEVERQMAQYARGVRGVPHFIVDGGSTVISGAQPQDTWEEIFEAAAAKGTPS